MVRRHLELVRAPAAVELEFDVAAFGYLPTLLLVGRTPALQSVVAQGARDRPVEADRAPVPRRTGLRARPPRTVFPTGPAEIFFGGFPCETSGDPQKKRVSAF